ncbi:UNVERIFIED_CONTAM: hypothetical protein H355_016805 [Colinus virginianus]|nr:hypothetical protein H355_016805 [Colinus virginianus]
MVSADLEIFACFTVPWQESLSYDTFADTDKLRKCPVPLFMERPFTGDVVRQDSQELCMDFRVCVRVARWEFRVGRKDRVAWAGEQHLVVVADNGSARYEETRGPRTPPPPPGRAPPLESDQVHLGLNIKADLSSCFNWNTKQLFLYVVAKYETPKNKRNEVILWDRIATQPKEAIVELLNEVNKYPLRDYGRSLRNRNITLHLEYVYHPIVGVMKTNSVASTTFTLPTSYFNFKETRGTGNRKTVLPSYDDSGKNLDVAATA